MAANGEGYTEVIERLRRKADGTEVAAALIWQFAPSS